MNNSSPTSIGEDVSKASRERSLQKMGRLVKRPWYRHDNASTPSLIAAVLFMCGLLTSDLVGQIPLFQTHPKVAFPVYYFLLWISGLILVNVLKSDLLNGYFRKSNADLFIEELRKYNPVTVDDLDRVCEAIKKLDYRSHWVELGIKIVKNEQQALLNS